MEMSQWDTHLDLWPKEPGPVEGVPSHGRGVELEDL